MARSSSSRHLAMLLSLAVLGGGAFVAYEEASAYFANGLLPREKFAILADGAEFVGLSTTAKRIVLDNCYDGLVAVYARTQPADRRDRLAEECRKVIDEMVARTPAHSFAWFVGAHAAARLDDTEGVIERLRQSQITGPNEQWITELRVQLAETYLDRLPADVRALHDRDLALLAASAKGVESIAARYVRDPSFRERITAIVEKMPQSDQRRFLSNVRRAAASLGGLT